MICGCKTSGPLMTPAALSAYVAAGAQIGVEAYPQAKPGVLLARDVFCASAAQTNINPNQIVADLGAAGITNNQAMIIVNGVILIYETAISQVGTNASKAQPYLQAACTGLTQAFPPTMTAVERVKGGGSPHQKPLPPHLRN